MTIISATSKPQLIVTKNAKNLHSWTQIVLQRLKITKCLPHINMYYMNSDTCTVQSI